MRARTLCFLVSLLVADPNSRWGTGHATGKLQNPDINESSGLAASWRNPGLYWTHNDSGDSARIFLMDRTGHSRGTWTVTAGSNRDWEDIAVGPGPQPGRSYLYIGDIGDNGRSRREIVVYRVPEPDASTGGGETEPATPLHFVYPDRPHDAEALLVHPKTGAMYIVIKARGEDADTVVYRAPAANPRAPSTLVKLDRLRLPPEFDLTAITGRITGGAISHDGRHAALCDYLRVYEFTVPPGGVFDDVWKQTPEVIDPGPRPQGESVTYSLDGKTLLLTSEGKGTAVFEVERK